MPDIAILIVAVSAVVCTTILLAIGFSAGLWAGSQAAARADMGATEELTTLKTEYANCLGQLATLAADIRASHELCEVIGLLAQSARPPLSSDLSATIERMLRTVRALEKSIHVLQKPETCEVRRSPNKERAWEQHSRELVQAPQYPLRVVDEDEAPYPTLTTQEMCDLIGGRERFGESTFDMESKRYPYDCVQQLAPWADDAPLPEKSGYTGVRCNDISVSGISFLWDQAPHFTRAILSIGLPTSPIYMVVQVVRYKAVYKHGHVCHLVECNFVSRLERLTESSAEREIVAS